MKQEPLRGVNSELSEDLGMSNMEQQFGHFLGAECRYGAFCTSRAHVQSVIYVVRIFLSFSLYE